MTTVQLRKDLALLAKRTHCVRTYTVSEGFDQVPAVADELGLEVLLGLWIGRDEAHNEQEIVRGIRIANVHRATISAIVVGNEVLLRYEQTAEELTVLIRRVAIATGLPVIYADVWGYWVDHKFRWRNPSRVAPACAQSVGKPRLPPWSSIIATASRRIRPWNVEPRR